MAAESPIAGNQAQSPAGPADVPTFSQLGVKHSNINCATGVELSERQKICVGSVLDLFEGNPTLKHFSLWSPNATFADPLAVATGYAKYTAQFYGLAALFKPIQIQEYQVVSSGNPLDIEMSTKYVLKGIRKEQLINSIVRISIGQDGKIERVEDRWNDKLPEGGISEGFRKLNAMTARLFVKVPKTEEEDMKMKTEREKE